MTKEEVKLVVENELKSISGFKNYHGISESNIKNHLIEPLEVFAWSPDSPEFEKEVEQVSVWLVLKEKSEITDGCCIAYDPVSKDWALIEHSDKYGFIYSCAGEKTLFDALNGM